VPFIAGSLLGLINLAGTAYAWPRIIDKKSIALPAGLIVSKFAFTIGLLYWLLKPSAFDQLSSWLFYWISEHSEIVINHRYAHGSRNLIAFIAGIALLVPALVVAHLLSLLINNEKDNSGDEV
jgi:hypothetical protein